MAMPIEILTNRFDNNRSGVNAEETTLRAGTDDAPGNVDPSRFGKLFTRTVDGDLYAQPLIVNGLTIGGTPRDSVVFLATSRNWVYCYDAEDPDAYVPLWTRQLGPAVPRNEIRWTPEEPDDQYLNFGSEIGITSTPVIAREAEGGAIYVVAKTISGSHEKAVYDHKLHALDLLTGQNRVDPVSIGATLPALQQAVFHPRNNLNRPGLLLQNDVLYLAFGSHDDQEPYRGWILAYDAKTLDSLAAYNTAPEWGEGGIWQSGTGLAGDGEHIYAVVGNGAHTDKRPLPDKITSPVYGNSLLKLKLDRAAGRFDVVDWFTTGNVFAQNDHDIDLIGGPVLFESELGAKGKPKRFLLGGGKDGFFYLADRNALGHWTLNNSGILQAKQMCEYHIHGAPVVWRSAPGNTVAYVWSEKDALKMYRLGARGFGPAVAGESDVRLPINEDRMPGGVMTLSWDGRDPDSAILWASHPTRENAMNKSVAGTLRAFKATDLKQELWNSDMDASGDDRLGNLAKFSPPVVANGKVYVGTFSRELAVYAPLKPRSDGQPPRDDLGDFELRDIGPNVKKRGRLSAGRYQLQLTGAGIGASPEGFLFVAVERNLSDGAITLSAQLDGFNSDHIPTARAGLIARRGYDADSDGMVALVVDRDGHVFVLRRDQPKRAGDKSLKVKQAGRARLLRTPANLRMTINEDDAPKGDVRFVVEVAEAPERHFVRLADFIMRFDVASNLALKVGLFATAQTDELSHPPADSAPSGLATFSKVSHA
jgi:hypothetical protein